MSPTNYSLVGNTAGGDSLGCTDYERDAYQELNETWTRGHRNPMWRLVLGVILSFLPQRWRQTIGLREDFPWVRATILSGVGETLLALVALVYWYSHSVTTWAASALDSALRNGPAASIPGQAIGLAGLVLWLLHPLTWFVGYFVIEGMVRLLAAVSTEQIFGTLPLAVIDRCYGKASGRPPKTDNPSFREQLQSLLWSVREKILVARSPDMPDQLEKPTKHNEALLRIHSSRPKQDWIPPKVVRIGDNYFRLERIERGRLPRPFIFVLALLPAGVPGRSVIVYDAPSSSNKLTHRAS